MRRYSFIWVVVCLTIAHSPAVGQKNDRGAGVEKQSVGGATRFNNVWALSIGVSEYEKYDPRLRFAHRDAEYFHQFVEMAYRQPHHRSDQFTLLTERNATKDNVNAWLNRVQLSVKENDLVILYFAGHGFVGSRVEPGYLLLYGSVRDQENHLGADHISLHDLNVQLSLFSERKAKVLLVLDACHAGKVADKSKVYSKVEQQNVFSILACQDNESAYESEAYEKGHGIFTWMLVQGLAGAAESAQDGVITLTELNDYLKNINSTFVTEFNNSDKRDPVKQQTPVITRQSRDIVFPYDPDKFKKFWQAPTSSVQANADMLNVGQQQLYQQLREALQRKDYLIPTGKSVADLFVRLYADSPNKDLLAPIYRQWEMAFQDEAQQAVNAYYKQDKINSWEYYQRVADLLTACLTYPQYIRADQVDNLRAQQSFLSTYAKYTQYQAGQLSITRPALETLFRDLIRQVSADTARAEQPAAMHNVIGLLWHELGDTTHARMAYTRARVLAPGWVMPLNNLANLVTDPNQKIAGYQQALKNNPNFYITLLNVANEYQGIKEYDKALEYLDKALKSAGQQSDQRADVLRKYALLYAEKAKTDSTQYVQALSYYRQAAETGGTAFVRKHDIDWSQAWVLAQIKQYDQAATYLDAYMEGANPKFKTEKAKEVYDDFMTRLADKPTDINSSLYYAIGYCHEKGYGVPKSLTEARRWYIYAANLGFKQIIGKLPQAGVNTATLQRHKRNMQNGLKWFTVPCLFPDGTKKGVSYVVGDYPADTSQVYAEETDRIRTVFKATVPEAVTESFQKLYRLAAKNNVSYKDLCKYAVDAAEKEKQQTVGQKQRQFVSNYQQKALAFAKISRADSVLYYTNQAVRSLIPDLQKPDETSRMLLDSIRKGTDYDGLYYYALGYLYEFKPSGREWSKAEKWYTYAFQVGYEPAYFRLLARARQIVSSSAAIWLTDNFNRGVKGYDVRCNVPDGSFKTLTLYLQDFPQTLANPLQEEAQRLKDVYGATPTDNVRNTFNRLYTEAQQKKQSFIETCKLQLATQSTSQKAPSKLTEADKLVAVGDTLYDKSHYVEAATYYRQAITKAVDVNERAWCYLRLGNALLADKQYDPAIEAYQSYIALQPRASAYNGLGIALRLQHKTDKSIEAIQKAIQLLPNEAYYHRMLGLTYYEARQYEAAITAYRRSLEIDPKNSDATNKVGLALFYLKRYEECLVAFDKGIELNPSATVYYQYLKGLAYLQLKDWPRAIGLFQKAVEANPKETDYLTSLGTAYYRSQQYERTVEVYQRVLAINAKDVDALNSIGIALTYLKRYDEGLTYLRRGIEAVPDKAGLFTYNIACNYALQGKKPEALQYLEEAIGKYKYGTADGVRTDTDFAGIKDSPEFKALLSKYFSQ